MNSIWKLFPAQKFVLCSVATYLFLDNIAAISMLQGPSMLPTFNLAGDVVLVDRLFWKWKEVELGQVFVYKSPHDPKRFVVKRVLGKPGDIIYIDPTEKTDKIKVPEGHLWMQGDNYSLSKDSRMYGPVSMGLIQGRIIALVFPTPRFISTEIQDC